MKVLIGNTL